MNTLLRVVALVVITAALVTFMSRSGPLIGKSQPNSHRSLQAKAHAARSGSAQDIRDFTDEIFNQQASFAEAAESLKERVSRCELRFREGVHEAIDERRMERAFNEQVRAFGAPAFWRTNQAQIQVLRGHRRQQFPAFVEPPAKKGENVAEAMAPAEAAYILMQLAANKFANPEFQVEPHIWNQRALERRRMGFRRNPGIVIKADGEIAASGAQATTSPDAQLAADLQSEDSEATAAAHRILDELGFQR